MTQPTSAFFDVDLITREDLKVYPKRTHTTPPENDHLFKDILVKLLGRKDFVKALPAALNEYLRHLNQGRLGYDKLETLVSLARQNHMDMYVFQRLVCEAEMRVSKQTQFPMADGYWLVWDVANDKFVLRHRHMISCNLQKYPWEFECAICHHVLAWKTGNVRTQVNVDHINEIKGDDRLSNLRILCNWCNLFRGIAEKKHPELWVQAVQELKNVQPWNRPSFDHWRNGSQEIYRN